MRVWRIVLAAMMITILNPAVAHDGTIETRVSQKMIKSFVENVFPVDVKKEVSLSGTGRVPVMIRLSNPRVVLLPEYTRGGKPVLRVDMDYALTGVAEKDFHTGGEISGIMNLTMSEDHESLVLSMDKVGVPVLPTLTLFLTSEVRPVKIPLFKKFPLSKDGQEIHARFGKVTIGVEDNCLIIKSDVVFEKKSRGEMR